MNKAATSLTWCLLGALLLAAHLVQAKSQEQPDDDYEDYDYDHPEKPESDDDERQECFLQRVVGPCRALVKRWYYSVDAGKCKPFDYGGCMGNANNFRTKAACQKRCNKEVLGAGGSKALRSQG